jgi:hypothetical protein
MMEKINIHSKSNSCALNYKIRVNKYKFSFDFFDDDKILCRFQFKKYLEFVVRKLST